MDRLREMLLRHEGCRLRPYKDTEGKLTIGVGRNLDDVGISQFEAMLLLSADLERVKREAVENFIWLKYLNVTRQDVVFSMIFNMGLHKFKEFVNTIDALSMGNYERAAEEMLHSKWALQVGLRAKELSSMMRTGTYV